MVGSLATALASATRAERDRRASFEAGLDSLRSAATEANRLAISYRDVNTQIPPLIESMRRLADANTGAANAQRTLNEKREALLVLIRAELGLRATLDQAIARATSMPASVEATRARP